MEDKGLGVRKGAWSKAEDALLRKCIETHGEGKWHLVPLRAGLNRCRKSCRLRWLNYLRPDINRTRFSVAEIELLIRLHKLLGNRWTLIAGRLPGRTANDVKNFWNSHVQKKAVATPATANAIAKETTAERPGAVQDIVVIKPLPIRLSHMQNPRYKSAAVSGAPAAVEATLPANPSKSPSLEHLIHETAANNGEEVHGSSSSRWWRDLLETVEIWDGNENPVVFSGEFITDTLSPVPTPVGAIDLLDSMIEEI